MPVQPRRGAAAVVRNRQGQPVVIPALVDADRGARPRILAHIGQRLLHHAVHGHARLRTQPLRGGRPLDAADDRGIGGGLARLVYQRGDVVVIGVRGAAEDAQQTFHIVQRAFRLPADRLHRAARHLGVPGAGVAAAVGLDDDDRQRVRHHVMHIAGDARAFGQRGDMAFLVLPGRDRLIAFAQHADRGLPRALPVGEYDRGPQARRHQQPHLEALDQQRGGAFAAEPLLIEGGARTVIHLTVSVPHLPEHRAHVHRPGDRHRGEQAERRGQHDERLGVARIAVDDHRIHHDQREEIAVQHRRAEDQMQRHQTRVAQRCRLRAPTAEHDRNQRDQRPHHLRRRIMREQDARRVPGRGGEADREERDRQRAEHIERQHVARAPGREPFHPVHDSRLPWDDALRPSSPGMMDGRSGGARGPFEFAGGCRGGGSPCFSDIMEPLDHARKGKRNR